MIWKKHTVDTDNEYMSIKLQMCAVIHKNMLDVTIYIVRLLLFMSEKLYHYATIVNMK